MTYLAQMLPDQDGCTALRKLMTAVLNAHETSSHSIPLPRLTTSELDALYELNAKLARDMRRTG